MFPNLYNVVRKFTGIDKLIEMVLGKLGTVQLAFVTGDYARGIYSGIIDVVIVGNIDQAYMQHLVGIDEEMIKRKIRRLVLCREEFERLKGMLKIESAVVVWGQGTKKSTCLQ